MEAARQVVEGADGYDSQGATAVCDRGGGDIMTKMEYILLTKDPIAAKSDKGVKQDIQKVLGSDGNDTFTETIKRTNVQLRFSIKKRNIENAEGSAYYLTISANNKSKLKEIEALESAHFKLFRNERLRKGYRLVVLRDDVSSHYCIKAYPIFHEYETAIRRLIYKYLIVSFGAMWASKTMTNDMMKQLKERTNGKSDDKLVTEALQDMDMSFLEMYLFDAQREVTPTDVVDTLLSDKNIENMTKEEMIVAIHRARPKSLWDMHFAAHFDIKDLKSKMGVIRINRNKQGDGLPKTRSAC